MDTPEKHNVILTAADSRVGDFLAEHWLVSLKANTNLANTDIVVLDYGLAEAQRVRLAHAGAKVVRSVRDGAIVAIRFRDIANFLRDKVYEQVMTTDGGDIIFQTDISPLFENNREEFRAVPEYYKQPIGEMARFQKFITSDVALDISSYLREKKMINAGVLLGPREKFIELCDFCFTHIADKAAFGPDQPLMTYFLYTHGFKTLPAQYNFILYTAKEGFSIRDGKFFDERNALIPIVHNAGAHSFVRAVRNFGFGPGHNTLKYPQYYIGRLLIRLKNAL